LTVNTIEDAAAFTIALPFIAFGFRVTVTHAVGVAIKAMFLTVQIEGLIRVCTVMAHPVTIEVVDIRDVIPITIQPLTSAGRFGPDTTGFHAFRLQGSGTFVIATFSITFGFGGEEVIALVSTTA